MQLIITNYDNSNPPQIGDAVCIISCGERFKRYRQSINESFEGRTGVVVSNSKVRRELFAVKINYEKAYIFNWQELFNIYL
jgi:hypothetical protein